MSARHDSPVAALPPIPAKRYFTIGEVSELCGVKPHVLRYWEQEFTQLRPMKRRGNRRYYQHHEVLLVRRIRQLLYEEGFTINGARNRLGDAAGSLGRARSSAAAGESWPSEALADGMAADAAQAAALAAAASPAPASRSRPPARGNSENDPSPVPAAATQLRAGIEPTEFQQELPFEPVALPPDVADRLARVRAELESVLRLLDKRLR